jgi:hypothetical protein
MTINQKGWEIIGRATDAIALLGFAIPLVDEVLQAHGIIDVNSDRQTLIIGGAFAAILATYFLGVAVAKWFFTPAGTARFHHPVWDALVGLACIALAAFCFTSPTKLTTPPPGAPWRSDGVREPGIGQYHARCRCPVGLIGFVWALGEEAVWEELVYAGLVLGHLGFDMVLEIDAGHLGEAQQVDGDIDQFFTGVFARSNRASPGAASVQSITPVISSPSANTWATCRSPCVKTGVHGRSYSATARRISQRVGSGSATRTW